MTRIVLSIEDDDLNQQLVRRLLADRPQLELRTAATARAGLDAARRDRPSLILLDNHLPDGTGADVIRELKKAAPTADIPVVVLTGETARRTVDALKLSASEILIKPFDVDDFIAMVDRHTGGSGREA